MLHASQVFGAPAYLARALGCAPHDVYRWIAGADFPSPAQCQQLESLLEDVLAQRASTPTKGRRWCDRQPVTA
jgi:DNA-binding transcriptional regulator YdaS (Cro superfamily)